MLVAALHIFLCFASASLVQILCLKSNLHLFALHTPVPVSDMFAFYIVRYILCSALMSDRYLRVYAEY